LPEPPYVIGIVVDPSFGDQLPEILGRMPIWIAATDANRRAVERARAVRSGVAFTEPGGLTTFRVDPAGTPEDWCADVLDDVAGHHDRYSHVPGYSAVEVIGVAATTRLLALLTSYGLTLVTPRPDGFIATTSNGTPAASPNHDAPPVP
jgi:hypothetical protein